MFWQIIGALFVYNLFAEPRGVVYYPVRKELEKTHNYKVGDRIKGFGKEGKVMNAEPKYIDISWDDGTESITWANWDAIEK